MINEIKRADYKITEKYVQMKSHISTAAYLTPNPACEEYTRIKRSAVLELYDIFKKYC